MFIPFRPRIKLTRFPVFTLLVTVASIAIYWNQASNEEAVYQSAAKFCTKEVARDVEYTQKNYIKSDWDCTQVLGHIYLWNHSSKHLDRHLSVIRDAGDVERAQLFEDYFREFSEQAPPYLTARLWQQRGSWNPLSMISSSLSHGSWDHVIGNLFFFISFSLVVELILGTFLYLFVFLVMALGIGTIDNLAHYDMESVPTLGLSGVVTGMLALAAFFAPKVKINYFYFFFLYIGFWRIPLWAVAIWYISWDMFDNIFFSNWSNTNYVAHLGGALIGLLLGATIFRKKRHWADDLILDDPSPLEDESFWYRLNIAGTMPVVIYFGFVVYTIVMVMLLTFITTFAVQLFMIAPMVAAAVMIYRSKHAERPDHDVYKEALQALANNRIPWAVAKFEKLAEGGYTRAQVTLAQLHLKGRGVGKLVNKAADWFRRAAASGNRDAQYQLGLLLADGRTVRKTDFEEIGWFEKAARQGLPAAAMALGYFYEQGRTGEVEKDKAADWYHKAGNDYLTQGAIEDARVALQQLQHVAPGDGRIEVLVAALHHSPGMSAA